MSATPFRHIFEPLRIGSLTVKNRIEAAPAAPMLATSDSLVSPQLIEYTRRLAQGGAGIVTVGLSVVNPEARVPCILNLADDTVVFQLSVLSETIQRYGARASIELTPLAFGPGRARTLDNIISPADSFSKAQILAVIDHFSKAVERCALAGMDMVLVHGGHGLFISNFFSPLLNHRSDEYGGTLENRARFAVQLLDAVRQRVGRKIAIEYRVSADELVEGGATLEDTIAFARMIEDKIDLLHVSAGLLTNEEVLKHTIQPIYFKRGYNVHYAAAFKRALKIPVATVGSIDLPLAEQIVGSGQADMVAMIRSLIADPQAVNKARTGQVNTICPCIRCNECVNRTFYHPLPLRCAVNPLAGREFEFRNCPLPLKTQKVVVIGGGPAGMQAARTLSNRGHQVVLFEKQDCLGGMLTIAKSAPYKKDIREYLEWAERMTPKSGNLVVRLSTAATAQNVRQEVPDVVIIATGAKPWRPAIKGIDLPHVVWAIDAERHGLPDGRQVVVAGGGLTGCEIALRLAQQGRQVTLVEMQSLEEMIHSGTVINMKSLIDLMRWHQVVLRTSTRLIEIQDNGVVVASGTKEQTLACDTVIVAMGVVPDQKNIDQFKDVIKELGAEVFVIGDAATARGNIGAATMGGFNAAMCIGEGALSYDG